MKCPYCSEIENKVIDSRLSKDASVIRRRRECLTCNRRFTTYEHIEEIPIMIMKKDGRRELFNREKVRSGMLKACEKRTISVNSIEEFIDEMERDLRESEEKEIPASVVGLRALCLGLSGIQGCQRFRGRAEETAERREIRQGGEPGR
jgi:transcriptional repressor NrdR